MLAPGLWYTTVQKNNSKFSNFDPVTNAIDPRYLVPILLGYCFIVWNFLHTYGQNRMAATYTILQTLTQLSSILYSCTHLILGPIMKLPLEYAQPITTVARSLSAAVYVYFQTTPYTVWFAQIL